MRSTLVLAACLCAAVSAHPAWAQTTPTPRPVAQHMLRRFSFSASPETVNAVVASGMSAWLTAQENPGALNDSGSELETLPTALNAQGGLDDYNIFERAVVQHMILTPRQLQAKLELHWLDHFSVGLGKVGDPAVMYHYDQTVRALALGNFTTLMTAVAHEPAMLEWLDNNWNMGPTANENFARECMQLYTMGTTRLNMDGSPVIGGKNLMPLPNYTQAEVQLVAKSMTGYGVVYDNNNTNPQTRVSVQYYPSRHYTGAIRLFGQTVNVPNDGTAIDTMMAIISKRPSVAPFMARELLQRFATETPSPQFISDIATVWRSNQDKPDQIARVITAIVNHADFAGDVHDMAKQPVELMFDALRQIPTGLQATRNGGPGNNILWQLNSLGQQIFWPVSVFSFYRPGSLDTLINTATVVGRTDLFASLTNALPADNNNDAFIDIPTLRARIGSTQTGPIVAYLLDAMLDGGTDQLASVLTNYLGENPTDQRLRSALWLLLSSPDYSVN